MLSQSSRPGDVGPYFGDGWSALLVLSLVNGSKRHPALQGKVYIHLVMASSVLTSVDHAVLDMVSDVNQH